MNQTNSNIKLNTFYGSSRDEQPGEFPFTHGVYPNMYLGKLWTMRQYAGFGSAEESNKRYKYLMDQGVMGLSVAFDLPTQTGYDSDHSLSLGEVGRVGVPISSLVDMEVLMKNIPLDKVSVSMTINSTASILLAFLIATAEKQGMSREKLRGTVQNDILKEYIARGTFIYPPKNSMRIITDMFKWCGEETPNWNTISISGYHIREAGATAVQELAFTFANGIAYVESAIEAGLDVDHFGKRLSFFFNAHNHFFEEISKFRAARRIWAKIMKNRFGATEPKAMMCRFHTQTAGSTLTAQQVDNNTVRTTIQAASAVLGGTQSLHTNAFDEALALPTESSARLALRTQQVIAYESGMTDVVDPFSGSYFVESLTDEIETKTMKLIQKIDDLGGAVSAIEMEFQQNEIGQSAYDYQKYIDSQTNVIVGVNKFREKKEPEPEILKINEEAVQSQLNRLKDLKQNRNTEEVKIALEKLRKIAKSTDNIMDGILNAVKHYATLGEISNVLREEFGSHL